MNEKEEIRLTPEIIYRIRKSLGVQQDFLADSIGMSVMSISNSEKHSVSRNIEDKLNILLEEMGVDDVDNVEDSPYPRLMYSIDRFIKLKVCKKCIESGYGHPLKKEVRDLDGEIERIKGEINHYTGLLLNIE